MSRIDLRRLLLISAAAFVLRSALAVLTEFKPIFPAYYYTDAREMDSLSAESYRAAREGRPFNLEGPMSQHIQVGVQSSFYRVVGPTPLLWKLANCAFGAAAVLMLGASFTLVFGPAPAQAAALAWTLWPSNAFFTSQNLKESPTALMVYAVFWLAFTATLDEASSPRRVMAGTAGAGLCLLTLGFYRVAVLLGAAGAIAAYSVISLAARRSLRLAPICLLFASVTAVSAYRPAARFLLRHWLLPEGKTDDHSLSAPQLMPVILPQIYAPDSTEIIRPTSPESLSRFREVRLASDRRYAQYFSHREIGTQIFPDARFRTWGDVVLFVPKGAFYALFMPLPGLYPLDGKVGRILSAAENLVLLALTVLGTAGLLRGPRSPERAALLLFFAAMAAGSALLEYDLGSASRHKLTFLPMLFPFAAEEALRLFRHKESP